MIGTFVFCTVMAFDYPFLAVNHRKFEIFSIIFIFGGGFFFAVIGLLIAEPGYPFYEPLLYGSWCWISSHYTLHRFVLHYLWIFIICLYLFITYSIVAYTAATSKDVAGVNDPPHLKFKVIKKIIGFPIIFFVVFVPLGVYRLIQWSHPDQYVPTGYVIFALFIFVFNGFFDAILYGLSRNIFCKVFDQTSSHPTT
eukprot:TRINITY_DN22231_c0_g1_i1.p1 TRINITY_DN22231_c0_g1~~TRINITY_DN22231_c0_g1_i1.p1  ORF type:complete len:196 (+),score=31.18 TRINITY_DN22231_c0_g1_i1:339-926(+)